MDGELRQPLRDFSKRKRIQTEILLAHEEVNQMDKEGIRQLLGVFHKVEVPRARGGLTLHQLEASGLELIKRSG
jgi:hypothetical protein